MTPSRLPFQMLRLAPRRLLALMLVLAACQPAPATDSSSNATAPVTTAAVVEATTAPTASAVPSATAAPVITLDPVTVSPTLDSAGAAGAVLGPEGGTLTATGADGSAFSLSVPAGSLFAATLISMTPVTALDNLPLSGGLAAGVQLEPDDLWLMVPATLVITPALALAPEQQDFFAYRGAGEDWHAYPPVTSTAALALSVYHFSGYGVGGGSAADRASVAGHLPGDRMAQIEAVIAELFRLERESQQQTGHGLPDFYDRLNEQVLLAFNQIVQPAIEAALQSDEYDVIAGALKLLISWQRFASLVDPDQFPSEIEYTAIAMQELLEHGVPIAGRECREQHNYLRIITIFTLTRSLSLLGLPSAVTALDEIRACLRFELTFVSLITEGGFGDPYGYRYELKGVVPLTVGETDDELVTGRLVGTGPLEYLSVAWIGEQSCTWATGGVGSVLNVQDGVNGVPYPFAPGATTVEITYDPGLPAEDVTMSCPSTDPLTWHTTAWKTYFDELHTPEKVETSYRLVTPMLGGDIIARSQQHLTTQGPGGQEVIEDTFIQIVHKPAP